MDNETKSKLGSQPSLGALATAKKIRMEKEELYSGFTDKVTRGIDVSAVPTNPRERMDYLKSRFPGLRNTA